MQEVVPDEAWPPSLPAGTRLGRYEIVRRLARGGMAEVYLARVRGLGSFEKFVAIKRILPEYAASSSFGNMFLDEARLAARLEHPNIVQVFDVDRVDGVLFLAMEYIPGTDFRSLLRAEPGALPLGPALAVAIATARALHHAHELRSAEGRPLQVVHRDVSPANILISSLGIVKLTDFGIAKAADNREVTRVGVIKGKAGYMAPEQSLGESVDRRTDVFSLGVVLYKATTGQAPFQADSDLALAQKISQNEAPPPSRIRPDYPPELEHIVLRAIRRDPDSRYQRAEDLAADLESFADERGLDVSIQGLASLLAARMPAAAAPSFVPELGDGADLTSTQHTMGTAAVPTAAQMLAPAPRSSSGDRRGSRRLSIGLLAACALAAGAFALVRLTGDSAQSSRPQASQPADNRPARALPTAPEASASAIELAPSASDEDSESPPATAASPPGGAERLAPKRAQAKQRRRRQQRATGSSSSADTATETATDSKKDDTSKRSIDAPFPGSWRPQ